MNSLLSRRIISQPKLYKRIILTRTICNSFSLYHSNCQHQHQHQQQQQPQQEVAKTMQAIEYHGNRNLKYVTDRPIPEITHPHDVKIKISHCGICGSDLHEYLDGPIFFDGEINAVSKKKKLSQCLGHELCGVITEVGSDVSHHLQPGQHVVLEANGSCLDKKYLQQLQEEQNDVCSACAHGRYNACKRLGFYGLGYDNGGFAEYIVASENKVIPYDANIIPDEVAALVEPLAVSWHGVRQSKIEECKSPQALILGGGPIGLCTIFALKGHKVTDIVVSEPAEGRRELAQSFGVKTFNPFDYKVAETQIKELLKMTKTNSGFTHVYDCSGNKATFNTMLKVLATGGVGTNVAIWPKVPIDFYPMDLTLNELYLTASMDYTKIDFELVVKAFETGLIDPKEAAKLVSKKVPLRDGIEHGILDLINNKEKYIKILLHP